MRLKQKNFIGICKTNRLSDKKGGLAEQGAGFWSSFHIQSNCIMIAKWDFSPRPLACADCPMLEKFGN